MFHMEHKMRLSNTRLCTLCLGAQISFPLSSSEPGARVGIAQWSDHVAWCLSEDSLACNLSNCSELTGFRFIEVERYILISKKCCMKIEALII